MYMLSISQKATLPTLRALANAPTSSPLAEIDQEAVVRFIVSLTRVNHEVIKYDCKRFEHGVETSNNDDDDLNRPFFVFRP